MTKVCTSLFKGSIPNLINFLQVQFSRLQRKRGECTNEGWSSTTMASSCSSSATCPLHRRNASWSLREANETRRIPWFPTGSRLGQLVSLSPVPNQSPQWLLLSSSSTCTPLELSLRKKGPFPQIRSSSLKGMHIYAWTATHWVHPKYSSCAILWI